MNAIRYYIIGLIALISSISVFSQQKITPVGGDGRNGSPFVFNNLKGDFHFSQTFRWDYNFFVTSDGIWFKLEIDNKMEIDISTKCRNKGFAAVVISRQKGGDDDDTLLDDGKCITVGAGQIIWLLIVPLDK